MDLDLLLTEMRLLGPLGSADVLQAITEPPLLERRIDGASSLTLRLTDRDGVLLRSGVLNAKSWVVLDDVGFEYVATDKDARGHLEVTFEDVIVSAMRRVRSAASIPAGTQTLATIARAWAAEAGVRVQVDPACERIVQEAVERGPVEGSDKPTDAWQVLGSLATSRGFRRLSDGLSLLIGSDAWLGTLVPHWRPVEHTGPVDTITWSVGTNSVDTDTATIEVDARRWSVNPGRAVTLTGQGPADGVWTVESFTRPLTRQRARVQLMRPRSPLPEPSAASLGEAIGPGSNEPGVDLVLALSGIRQTSAPRPPATVRQADGPESRVPGWAWPTYDKRVTSEFGPRRSPGGVGSTNHAGLDIGVRTGTQVFAARAGRVTWAGLMGGYGLAVNVDHGGGLLTRYAHLSRIDVRVGQEVTIGTLLGLSGATGNVTGPHLHFEVRVNGVAKNPRLYLP